MNIEDVQHINVNKLLHVLGKEVMYDVIANALAQNKKEKLIQLVTERPVEFVNQSQTWSNSTHYSGKGESTHPDRYWQFMHDKCKRELPALLNDTTTFADETPLFLFADVFAEKMKEIATKRKVKVWN